MFFTVPKWITLLVKVYSAKNIYPQFLWAALPWVCLILSHWKLTKLITPRSMDDGFVSAMLLLPSIVKKGVGLNWYRNI